MKIRGWSLSTYGLLAALLIALGLVAAFAAVEVSSTPQFCGSCHVMGPYYESWTTSTHSEIACVECHISPGVTAAFRKKFEGISMVAQYFTGTYGTNPWAEVEDSACLRCHERRLLGVSTEVFGDILFDHRPHLSELRRGKQLRCTSCHSQIVQGSHIKVTSTSCLICHFKGQEPGVGTARCTLCHEVPDKIVHAGGLDFDHGEVSRLGMECQSCHIPAGPGEGGVPRERCVTCHNEQDRLEKYEETDEMHRIHVTDHKVECTNCHLEVEHVVQRLAEAPISDCSACHATGHSPQKDLYVGIGGEGVESLPDVMFQAGVRCEGCHFDSRGPVKKAGAVSCMSCHGPSYNGIYESWTRMLDERTRGIRRQLDSTAQSTKAREAVGFDHARANVELLEEGRGIHNVPYSLRILDAAHRQINQAREEAGLSVLDTPWPKPPYESDCFACHTGIESVSVKVFGRSFSHRPHVIGQGRQCETCHSTHEERRSGGVPAMTLEASSCNECHHGEEVAATSCLTCHASVKTRTFDSDFGDFDHAMHVDDMELECSFCHGEPPKVSKVTDYEICSDCH